MANTSAAIREYKRQWRLANRDRLLQLGKENYKRNRERRIDMAKAWASANPGKVSNYKRNWKARNRRYEANFQQNRRDLYKLGTITPELWDEILDYFNSSCAYCLRNDVKLTMDHFRPINKDGLHTADNVVPSCASCNSMKNDSLIFDFIPRMEKKGFFSVQK